jgi:hypothetical protein
MTRIASDGRATISELEVLLEPGAWIVRARLEGSARRVALLFPVPGEASAELGDAALLDELDHRTAPRLAVTEASDPCAAEEEKVDEELWPERESEPAPGFEARVIAPQRAAQLDVALAGLDLDGESKTALARTVRDGGKLVVLFGPAPGKLRGFWTAPVRIRVDSRSLPLGFAAPHVTVGRALRVHLYARGSLAPDRKTADLAAGVFVPEVAFEDPLDLFRAAASQTIRREGEGTAIRIFSGDVQRWLVEVGRGDERRALMLKERALQPFRARWMIRRAWRKPISCREKERYLNIVRIQQKTEIQTYAAITGRPQSAIETRMRERGYLLENGRLSPVEAPAR